MLIRIPFRSRQIVVNSFATAAAGRIVHLHYNARVVATFTYMPWVKKPWWNIKRYRGASGLRYIDIGSCQFVIPGKALQNTKGAIS